MAPSAMDIPALPIRQEKTYPPARIYNVKETKFDKPIPAQPDGREEALERPAGSVAIVIDNGAVLSSRTYLYTLCGCPAANSLLFY